MTGRFATVSGGITSESIWYPDTATFTFEGSGRIGDDASYRSDE